MPLRDHFRPPTSLLAPFPSLHAMWATHLVGQLNQGVLPVAYFAVTRSYPGSQAQVDVGAVHDERDTVSSRDGNGGVATAVWAPPQPPLVAAVDLAGLEAVEVLVMLAEQMRLVAAVELVSPANKDRPSHRNAFVSKVAAYLQEGLGVIVVDVVTERHISLHRELMQFLPLEGPVADAFAADLYAVAYRLVAEQEEPRLEMWPVPLAIGAVLPRMPLWIAPDRAVPLDLETSYTTACQFSRLT